ncbi:MAG TPA: NAD(P)H-hydrate dehydratase [Tepidisphaeraceae bacterium]|jgi:NAD(P)H-hydrate epimerase
MKITKKLAALPARPRDGHKGMFGRLLVLGGSQNMIGAPVLAGTAALRSGAGLVQIAMPASVLATAISITPELIGLGLANNDNEFLQAADKADAIVIGPGMGEQPDANTRLKSLLRLNKPMILDADALNLISAAKKWPDDFAATAVLTPHPGEMKRLLNLLPASRLKALGPLDPFPTDDAKRLDIALAMAELTGQTIVLKGHRTVITDGNTAYYNTTGDSSLSKAGSGDVLSGILGCLLAQKLPPFDAACIAVHLHGLAGEIAGEQWGLRSPLARDVIHAIPQAIERLKW